MAQEVSESVRGSFVEQFGEDQAAALERAAEGHANGINSERRGDDPFKWAILIAIGYQCAEKEDFRDYHGITAPWDEVKAWIKAHADLASHNGDCDFICLFVGGYNDFVQSADQAAA